MTGDGRKGLQKISRIKVHCGDISSLAAAPLMRRTRQATRGTKYLFILAMSQAIRSGSKQAGNDA
jgi:hypothetical protein